MFSYKAFIKSCLNGRTRPSDPRTSLKNINTKEVQINSLDFSSTKPPHEHFIYSPKVPQLPSMSIPQPLSLTYRPKSIDFSPEPKKEKSTHAKIKPASISPLQSPEFPNKKQSSLRVSSLNTKYNSNQAYIMKNLEKAKKYFPIPLGRKQLRTTSMSISHTPMTRLYSPQNFLRRNRLPKHFLKSPELQNSSPGIEVEGRRTGFKYQVRTSKNLKHIDMYDLLLDFSNKLELFRRKFEEIDKQAKGYLVLEDFKACFERGTAVKVLELFGRVTGRKQVFIQDFFAVCAVYLHNGGDVKKFKLGDEEVLKKLEMEIVEMKDIFEVHTKGTMIPKIYLQGLREFLQSGEDVLKAESLILTQNVDFVGFLRWIPYFLYMHVQLLNKTFH